METPRAAFAALRARADRWIGAWLVLSGVLLAAGLFLPAVTVGGFFLAESYSLAEAVFGFAARGQWLLFALTFLFSMAFPLGKVALCLALRIAAPAGGARLAGWLAALSRWSMVDVFIVALVVLVVDGQLLTTADVHSGVAAFAAGALLSGWAARRTVALAAAA